MEDLPSAEPSCGPSDFKFWDPVPFKSKNLVAQLVNRRLAAHVFVTHHNYYFLLIALALARSTWRPRQKNVEVKVQFATRNGRSMGGAA